MAKEKEVKNTKKTKKEIKKEKKNIIEGISNFINGVKVEFKRVKWPSKKEMAKYSVTTISFIIFCSLFFYVIELIIAALHSIG